MILTYPLHSETWEAARCYSLVAFDSDVVGRLISFGIRCTWTEAEVTALSGKIRASVEKALNIRAYA